MIRWIYLNPFFMNKSDYPPNPCIPDFVLTQILSLCHRYKTAWLDYLAMRPYTIQKRSYISSYNQKFILFRFDLKFYALPAF